MIFMMMQVDLPFSSRLKLTCQLRLKPDANCDQDGPRYTELTVMYHYWALFALKYNFAVIRIHIWIIDPDADFEQDGSRYT